MKYILLVIAFSGSVSSVEFNSLGACERAAYELLRIHDEWTGPEPFEPPQPTKIMAICKPKGKE